MRRYGNVTGTGRISSTTGSRVLGMIWIFLMGFPAGLWAIEPPEQKPSAGGQTTSWPGQEKSQTSVAGGANIQLCGFVRKTGTGSGQLWHQQYPQLTSARRAGGQALREISQQLNASIRLLGNAAVADLQDQDFLMMFSAEKDGRSKWGILRATVYGQTAFVIAAWDDFGKNLADLLTQAFPPQPGGMARPVRWQTISFPGGTGSIRLPEGWRITGVNTPFKGAISAEGPHGYIDLGYALQVTTPDNPSLSIMPRPDLLPVAPYSNPEQATADVFRFVARVKQQLGDPPMRWGNVVKSVKVSSPFGQAAFVHYRWKRLLGDQWQPMESLGYVEMAPAGFGAWMYYSSGVAAPASQFSQNLGLLLEIWASWHVEQWVHVSRLVKALQTQQEIFGIQQECYQYHQQVSDRVWKAWSEVNRGLQAVLDRDTGKVGHLDLRWADDMVRIANELEGTDRWIKVNPFQYNY